MGSHAVRPAAFVLGSHKWRTDLATAHMIDQCLAVQVDHGTYDAAALLCVLGVDIHVAMRVLGRPHLRRKPLMPGSFQPRIYGSVPYLAYREKRR